MYAQVQSAVDLGLRRGRNASLDQCRCGTVAKRSQSKLCRLIVSTVSVPQPRSAICTHLRPASMSKRTLAGLPVISGLGKVEGQLDDEMEVQMLGAGQEVKLGSARDLL